MSARVTVKPQLLRWARERAGRSSMGRKIGTNSAQLADTLASRTKKIIRSI